MKNTLLKLLFILILILGPVSLFAQDFDLKVKADTILIPGSNCIIEISVIGGAAPFTYMLYDNEPWEGGKLLEKTQETNEMTHSFTIRNAGRYLLAVRDKKELTKIIIIQVKLAVTALIRTNTNLIRNQYLL